MRYQTQPSLPGMPGNNQHFQFDGQAGLASLNKVQPPQVKVPTTYGAAAPAGNGNVISPIAQRTTVIPKLNPESRKRSTEGFTRGSQVPVNTAAPIRAYQPGSNGMPGGIGNAAYCD
jgi:hypothetical protein